MNWFKPRLHTKNHAVLTPIAGGVAAMRVQDDGVQARVLTYVQLDAESGFDRGTLSAELLRRAAGDADIKSTPLIVLLNPDSYQTLIVEAPSVPDDELKSAIRWKVKDLLSFHIDDAVIDHLPVPGGGGRPATLYVVAAQSSVVRALAQPFHDVDLQLDVIDIRETAQHYLAMRIAPADYAVAVLHFDGDNGLLTFSFGASLIMSRRIEGRGAAGENLFDKVALETQRSVDYFERQYSWLSLAKLYLAPMSQAPALLRRLNEYLPIGSENFDLTKLFDLSGQPALQDEQSQNSAFHVLGASLRHHAGLADKAA